MVVDHPDQLVDQVALGAQGQVAGRALLEAPPDLRVAAREGALQRRQHLAPPLGLRQAGVRQAGLREPLQLALQGLPVDDRAAPAHHRLVPLRRFHRRVAHGRTMP